VFNNLIVAYAADGVAVVREESVAQLVAAILGVTPDHVYKAHWLDIEDAYREAGWHVVYDRPRNIEDYPATFTFKKAGERNHDARSDLGAGAIL
jgi:hypothetical protein